MTWQMASFGLLAIALVAGFTWYERSHPSSKVLALVATLAALAVLGRMAFAPIPSVKPTTDIVLLAGGWYFATETARILGGAGGALLPPDGAALLQRRLTPEVAS